MRRTINGLLLGGAVIAGLKWLPGWALFVALAAFTCAVQAEFYLLMRRGGHPSRPALGCVFGLLWLAGKFAFAPAPEWLGGADWEGVFLGAFMFALLAALLFDRNAKPVEQAAVTCFGFMYVPFLLGFCLPLATYQAKPFDFSSDGVFLVFYMLLIVKMTDVGAFAVGCSIGRHKMFPRVSPKKSWEGLAGGLAAAVGFSVALVLLSQRYDWIAGAAMQDWPVSRAVWVGLALAAVGVLGDLFESMLKRAVDVKDSGGIVPGLGGFLDMFDSILFAPLAFVMILRWVAVA